MGIFDVGAGTSIGFSGNLGDAKNIWRQNQATIQASKKAAADKNIPLSSIELKDKNGEIRELEPATPTLTVHKPS